MTKQTGTSGEVRLLTRAEVAEQLNVTERWVRRALEERRLRKTKLGGLVRIHPADVADLIENAREVG